VQSVGRVSLIGRLADWLRSIDWSRRRVRTGVALATVSVAVWAAIYIVDLIEGVDFAFDDVVYALITASICALVYVYRADWNRRDVREGLLITALALATYSFAHFFELPPKLFQFAIDNADYEIDDAIFVLFIMSIALAVYVYRRLQDLYREVEARRTAESNAQRLARHDPLTGLPNRRYFNEKLDDALHNIVAEGRRGAVLMLDLDGFKAINDVHGHIVGDKALIEFSERVTAEARGALVARVGGDEFAIVLPRIASLDDATGLARRITQACARPFVIAGTETSLGVCIGIAVTPDDGTTADELVRRADLALYRAKAEGRSSTRFFEQAMDAHVERRNVIERELRSAIATEAIEVHFQPLVHLDGGRIIGFEALARWMSPVLGHVLPNVFIAVAEECGLINQLGEQLLRKACHEALNWPDDFTLAFNISPLQLRNPTLGLRVLNILADTGLPATRLELEITESAIVGDAALAQKQIDELRAAGVRIALDDFGTGYATMSQLLAFRFDKIKIDRSFINNLGSNDDGEVIVRAIIGLAKGLGLVTTAEGIEKASQLADLKADGCIEGQGYLFGKAIPAEEIPVLLQQRRAAAVA
jgi:diguanylate cyclase (GGDEF)-like protein